MKFFFEPSSKKFNVAAQTSVEKNARKNLVHPLPDGKLRKNLTFFFNQVEKKFNVAARTSVEKNTWKNLVHPLPYGDLNPKKI